MFISFYKWNLGASSPSCFLKKKELYKYLVAIQLDTILFCWFMSVQCAFSPEAFGMRRCSKSLLQLGTLPCCTMAWLSFAQTAQASEGTNINMVYEVGSYLSLEFSCLIFSYYLVFLELVHFLSFVKFLSVESLIFLPKSCR